MKFSNAHIKLLIKEEENEEAMSIIEEYNLYESVDIFRLTLLHYSAKCGNRIIVEYLLNMKCDINAQDYRGWTPLMHALTNGHMHTVQILLTAGADIFVTDNDNQSSFQLLLRKDYLTKSIFKLTFDQLKKQCLSSEELTRKLIEDGGRLDHAINLKDARVLECMLQQGFPVNWVQNIEHGRTILHLAVCLCDIECVKVLVKYKVNVSARNVNGVTPIAFLFCDKKERNNPNQIEILNVLLDAGAMLMTLCDSGNFQISTTLIYGPCEAIKVLLKSGKLDFEARNTYNEHTVLHLLARNRNSGIAEVLERYVIDLDPNVFDGDGASPLHGAAYTARVDMLKYLLKLGAEVNAVDNGNLTPLFTAFSNDKPDLEHRSNQCIEILLQHNTDPQHVVVRYNKQLTIFDTKAKTSRILEKRLKPVVAQIALMEKCNTPVVEIISTKINSLPKLQKYFARCQKFLDRKISGRVSFLKLFTANKKTVAKLLNRRKLVTKLMRMSRKRKLLSSFAYYNNTLKKRLANILLYKKLKNKADAALSQLFEYRIDRSNIIVDKIVEYLDEQDLKQMYQI